MGPGAHDGGAPARRQLEQTHEPAGELGAGAGGSATTGHDVIHLDARGGTDPHRLTEFALVEGEQVRYPPRQAELDV